MMRLNKIMQNKQKQAKQDKTRRHPDTQDKTAAIFQTTFSNAFSWMKMFEFRSKISLKFIPKGPINNIPSLVQVMAWRHYLNQWWLVYWRIYASLGLNELINCLSYKPWLQLFNWWEKFATI